MRVRSSGARVFPRAPTAKSARVRAPTYAHSNASPLRLKHLTTDQIHHCHWMMLEKKVLALALVLVNCRSHRCGCWR